MELLKLRRRLRPETFYEQLAKDDLLEEYLYDFYRDRYATDEEFRAEMYEILMRYSKRPVVAVEAYFLERMIASLSYFLEYTEQWRTQKH